MREYLKKYTKEQFEKGLDFKKDILERKKVIVKFNPDRYNVSYTSITPNHVCKDVMDGAKQSFGLPLSRSNGGYIKILQDEERVLFEKEMSLKPDSMSFYNTGKDSFWNSKKAKVHLTGEPLILDLSIPLQYIQWRICIANDNIVALNWETRNNNPACKWVLIDEDYELQVDNALIEKETEAFEKFIVIKKNKQKILDIFKVMGRTYSPETTIEKLVSELGNVIKNHKQVRGVLNIDDFLKAVNDPKASLKVLLEDLIRCGLILKTKTTYKTRGGDTLGTTLEVTLDYLDDISNKDVVDQLKLQLKQLNK